MEAISKAADQEALKEKWQITLERLYGSTKYRSKKPFTKEIRDKLAREHTPEEAKAITKKFGLEHLRE